MKAFLCGGGCGTQTLQANKRLNEIIDHSKPCLYIPLAMISERYDSCYEWIQGELKHIDIPYIEMIRSAEELATKNLFDYSFLFIGGGNTFKLLKELKTSSAYQNIANYLEHDGIIFGGSAGAIIFGEDIEPAIFEDSNDVNLQDTSSFNLLHDISVFCHYTNSTPDKNKQSKQFLLELSKQRKIIALPEEVTLFLNDNILELIGNRPYYFFENGIMYEKYNI